MKSYTDERHTYKINRDFLILNKVLGNQKMVNVHEHTVKTAPSHGIFILFYLFEENWENTLFSFSYLKLKKPNCNYP